MQGAFALVRGSASASNLLEPSRTTALQKIALCEEFMNMGSGWFNCRGPLLTSLEEKQSAQALVRGSSSTSNHLEPHHCRCKKSVYSLTCTVDQRHSQNPPGT